MKSEYYCGFHIIQDGLLDTMYQKQKAKIETVCSYIIDQIRAFPYEISEPVYTIKEFKDNEYFYVYADKEHVLFGIYSKEDKQLYQGVRETELYQYKLNDLMHLGYRIDNILMDLKENGKTTVKYPALASKIQTLLQERPELWQLYNLERNAHYYNNTMEHFQEAKSYDDELQLKD